MPFYAQKRQFNWIDIGQVADYWAVLQRVLKGEISDLKMPGTEVKPGVWVGLNTRIDWDNVTIEGPVYIDSGVCIKAGAKIIGPAWISNSSHICRNATLIQSITLPYTRISAEMTFDQTIVSPKYYFDHKNGVTYYLGDENTRLRWGDARRHCP